MRVVFLDFDGVLNSALFFMTYPGKKERLDPAAVKRLDVLVKRAGAKVVVTSSWRAKHSVEGLARFLKEAGFSGEVAGVTPDLGAVAACDVGFTRCREIEAFLQQHPSVSDYVILDDLFLEDLAHAQVKTEFEMGLGDEHVEMALGILGVD